MTVTEAPGYRELEEMTPLVGPAGKLFNGFLLQAGIKREEVFLANTCGCVDLSREDRRPLPVEIESCKPRLLDDITVTNPQCIVAMGNIGIQLFFPGITVSKARGCLRNWTHPITGQSYPVICTYHPAFALPHRSPHVAELIVEDIKTALSLTHGNVPTK
jgi:DNA polymerase